MRSFVCSRGLPWLQKKVSAAGIVFVGIVCGSPLSAPIARCPCVACHAVFDKRTHRVRSRLSLAAARLCVRLPTAMGGGKGRKGAKKARAFVINR